jgi:hypothetical protein
MDTSFRSRSQERKTDIYLAIEVRIMLKIKVKEIRCGNLDWIHLVQDEDRQVTCLKLRVP